jgi:hypothetical protein
MDAPETIALHRSTEELHAGLDVVRAAPRGSGTVDLIVRRPVENERELLDVGELSLAEGLVGDTWQFRSSRNTPDGSPDPMRQLTVMNSRAAALVAVTDERWPLCGDQFYVDMDISVESLPPGTLVRMGEAVIEFTEPPHNGCAKFTERFGLDAMRFVNSDEGKALRLRGANARVVEPGAVRAGDAVTVL